MVASTAFETAVVPKHRFDLLPESEEFTDWTHYDGAEREPLTTTADPVACLARR